MSLKYFINKHVLNRNIFALQHLTRNYSQDSQTTQENATPTKSGYAKAFEKFQSLEDTDKEKPHTFRELLMKSKFIDLGDPEGKIVIGKIFHIVEDDLYIDFGWKFHCVCTRPKANSSSYIRGAKVRLMIKELELSSRFLGYERDLTLLEADCVLLGLSQDQASKIS
ncbi:mitochondrial 28s ribosomal protein s28 [Holotrichia oblita]|uniref:Mitochondrial 28s ribosomal protein s28 n=2 Tax=Holotrichia oblita TaxID=644536 RepID=A0ACB9TY89_HOLOL|nr:mitochondrial 28s ribosomal protein s28 [Holotrichia oblita]KAI4471917.1 mitochondrial 28s ribosomal protein s28 [Holotrichia oblita]